MAAATVSSENCSCPPLAGGAAAAADHQRREVRAHQELRADAATPAAIVPRRRAPRRQKTSAASHERGRRARRSSAGRPDRERSDCTPSAPPPHAPVISSSTAPAEEERAARPASAANDRDDQEDRVAVRRGTPRAISSASPGAQIGTASCGGAGDGTNPIGANTAAGASGGSSDAAAVSVARPVGEGLRLKHVAGRIRSARGARIPRDGRSRAPRRGERAAIRAATAMRSPVTPPRSDALKDAAPSSRRAASANATAASERPQRIA